MNFHVIKLKLYLCLIQPKTAWHILYHLTVFGYVLLSLCLNAVLTLKKDQDRNVWLSRIVFVMEFLLSVYFTLELILRLWAAGAVGHYQGFYGRLKFMTHFTCIIDLLILTTTIFLLAVGDKQYDNNLTGSMIKNLRFLQILRLFHVDRRASTWKLVVKVLRLHRTELLAASYLALLGLLVMSTLVYMAEDYYAESKHEHESVFKNYGDALWWGVVTLTTIGYGDIVPRWWISKLITSIFAIACVSLFTLTSSIIGVGLALMVQDKSRQKYMQKHLPIAAAVLQTFWRQRMLANHFDKISYYRYNLTQKLIAHELTPYSRNSESNQEMNGKTVRARKNGTMFTFVDVIRSRVATAGVLAGLNLSVSGAGADTLERLNNYRTTTRLKNNKIEMPRRHSADNLKGGTTDSVIDAESLCNSNEVVKPVLVNEKTMKSIFTPPSKKFEVKIVVEPAEADAEVTISVETPLVHRGDHDPDHGHSHDSDYAHTHGHTHDGVCMIPGRYKQALKAIWRMKFMVAKKKFKSSRKLYDLNDVSDEVSHCAFAQINGIKKAQTKVDRVVGRPTISLLTDSQKELGLFQRLEVVEMKMAELDKKADLILQLATQLSDRIVNQQKQQQKRL